LFAHLEITMADAPIINGNAYSWASIGFAIDGIDTPDLTEITYSPSLDPGKVRGLGRRVKATTAGEADADGSFSMLKGQAAKLIKSMGDGFMLKRFSITVSYDEDGEGGIVTDELFGVRITKVEDAPKQGNEAVVTKFDIHIMRLKLNGVDPHGTKDDA
jgi:hypothetical protein